MGTIQTMIWGMVLVGIIFLCMSYVFHAPTNALIVILTAGQLSIGASMSAITTGYYSLATLIFSNEEAALSYIESAVGIGEHFLHTKWSKVLFNSWRLIHHSI